MFVIIIMSSFCWSKAQSRGQDRRSIRENQVREKLHGCKMMVEKSIPRWFSHYRRSGGNHLPKYHHRRPKRSWRAWCALGVWRLLFTGYVAPTLKCHFLGIFLTNLKMLGGAIRDLVFENVVIGGEKIEAEDHFYTNEFVFDLHFS